MSWFVEAAMGVLGLVLIDHFARSSFSAMCVAYFFGSTLAVSFYASRHA